MRHRIASWFFTLLLLISPGMLVISAAEPPAPVKIGILLPMTGPDAAKGIALYEGVTTAHSIESFVTGTSVTLISADTESSDGIAESAMKRLIDEDRVIAIIGDGKFLTGLRACELSRTAGVPLIIPALFDQSLPANCDYLFRTCLPGTFQCDAGARYARQGISAQNAAILIDISDETSITGATLFRKYFTGLGGRIVAIAYCRSGDTDFGVQLEHILSQKAELVFLPDAYPEVARFSSQARRLGYKGHLLATEKVHHRQFIELGGDGVEGVLLIDHFDKDALTTERSRACAEIFFNERGRELNPVSALGADAYFVLCNALERAQTFRGREIRKALGKTKAFPGVTGLITLTDDGNSRIQGNLFQVKEGRFVYLEPIGPLAHSQ